MGLEARIAGSEQRCAALATQVRQMSEESSHLRARVRHAQAEAADAATRAESAEGMVKTLRESQGATSDMHPLIDRALSAEGRERALQKEADDLIWAMMGDCPPQALGEGEVLWQRWDEAAGQPPHVPSIGKGSIERTNSMEDQRAKTLGHEALHSLSPSVSVWYRTA